MAPEAPKSSASSSQAEHPPSVHASHPALAPFPYPGAPYPPIPAGAYPPFVYATTPLPDGHHDPNATNGAPPPQPFYMAYPPPPPGMVYAFPAPPPGANGQGSFENDGVIMWYQILTGLLIFQLSLSPNLHIKQGFRRYFLDPSGSKSKWQ